MTSLLLIKQEDKDANSWGGIVASMKNPVVIHRNKPGAEGFPIDNYQFVIRWGCRGTIPEREDRGIKVVNASKYIKRTVDKAGFRANIPNLCPKTFLNVQSFRDEQVYPCVVRPRYHLRGENFHVCNDGFEVQEWAEKLNFDMYIQEYIEKEHEYRVYIVQNRIIGVTEKQPKPGCDKHVWNQAEEININWGQWPMDVVTACLKAFQVSGLAFGAVDVITDKHGNVFVLEINTSPEITPYRQQCFAKAFDYIIDNDNHRALPVDLNGYNWRGFIHPSMSKDWI